MKPININDFCLENHYTDSINTYEKLSFNKGGRLHKQSKDYSKKKKSKAKLAKQSRRNNY